LLDLKFGFFNSHIFGYLLFQLFLLGLKISIYLSFFSPECRQVTFKLLFVDLTLVDLAFGCNLLLSEILKLVLHLRDFLLLSDKVGLGSKCSLF